MHRSKTFEYIIATIIALVFLEFIVVLLGIFTPLTFTESFRIIFGSIYVLFLPGFVWSFVFFDGRSRKVDLIERIALSFALSIAIVPLAVFYLNLVGLPISGVSSFFVVLVLTLVGLGLVWWRNRAFA